MFGKINYTGDKKIVKRLCEAINWIYDNWLPFNVDSELSTVSENPVQNKVITVELNKKVEATVNNLVNYYTKSETYTQAEVDALISGIAGMHFEVVQSLPVVDISTNTIYLLPKETPGQDNTYDEYINTDGTAAGWELIGTTDIDLTNYVTTTDLTTALSAYTPTANLATVATSGDYGDLINTPTIPAAQVNSDWNAVSGVAQILNKPTLAAVATSGDYDDLINKPTIPSVSANPQTTTDTLTGIEIDGVGYSVSGGGSSDLTDAWRVKGGTALTASSESPIDLNTFLTSGTYYMNTDAQVEFVQNKPALAMDKRFTLIVQRAGNSSACIRQIFIGGYDNKVFWRFTRNTGSQWFAWEEMAYADKMWRLANGVQLSPTADNHVDLDTLDSAGTYFITSDIADRIDNKPTTSTNRFTLIVQAIGNADEVRIKQIYMPRGTQANYIRYKDGSTANWSSWKETAFVDAIPTALSQLTDDSTHRLVTDTEKSGWNAKSDFSGSYNDLTDKPTPYSLPLAADGTRGGIQIGFTQIDKKYPVQLSNEEAYVEVPWTDTNTTYTAGQGLVLNSTTFKLGSGTVAHYSRTGSGAAYIQISINSTKNWMISFRVRLYGNYICDEYIISGYQYGSNYWYSPSAILTNSDGTARKVIFGYTSANNLWVAIPDRSYTGCDIIDVVNGYTQVDSFDGLFTLTRIAESSLATKQTEVTVNPPIRSVTTGTIGSASKGTNIAADDITAWSAGSVPSASVSNGRLTLSAGSAPSLSYTARSIPNISVTSTTVVTGASRALT